MGIDAKMLIRTREPVTQEHVTNKAHALVSAFGTSRLSVMRPGVIPGYTHHALSIVPEYEQDGDTIVPDDGETFIRVHLSSRYYGEGYERGDISTIIAIANWLDVHFPGASIWYGGDSSGVCVEPFDADARAKVWAHFCAVGHDPYARHGSRRGTWPVCDFCGGIETASCGGGQDREFCYCSGCDWRVIVYRDGRRVEVPRGKDFFDMKD